MKKITRQSAIALDYKLAGGFDDDFYGGPAPEPIDRDWGDPNYDPEKAANYEPSRQELQQYAHMQLKQQGYSGDFNQASRSAFKDHLDQRYVDAENATRGHMLVPSSQAKGVDPRSLFHGPMAAALYHASPELKNHWNEVGRPTYTDYRESLITGLGKHDINDYTHEKVAAANPYAVHPALEAVKNAWTQKSNAGPAPAPRNPQMGAQEAKAYEQAPDQPNHPALASSYKALNHALVGQYNDLRAGGITFKPHTGAGEPYANSDAMRADLANGQMSYRPTDINSDLPANHPMSQTVNTVDGPKAANDVFRSVHDALGHGFGASFGPQGEQQAWQNHRATLPPEAHAALYTETRAQNAWTNYGPHMQDGQGNLLPKEQQMPVAQRPFAPQKSVYLPHLAATALPPTISDRLYGKGFNALFTGDAPKTTNPFQAPMRLKTDKPIDPAIIAQGLQNPQFNDFDPRTLKSSQSEVTRAGVKHYMNNPQELFNDAHQAGNQHPVVYTKPTGENVLLTGNHRAASALLQGQPLRAIHIKAPQ